MSTPEVFTTPPAPLWNTTEDALGNTTEYFYEYDDDDDSFPLEEGLPMLLAYSLTLVVGLVGNSLVIFSIAYYKRMRTTTNVFLFSLATADLLLVLVCVPIKAASFLTYTWTYGEFLCKLVHYVQNVSMVCSVLTLTSISLERVIAVASPLKARTICTMRHAKIVVIVVWFLSFLLAIPTILAMNLKQVGVMVIAYWCYKSLPMKDHNIAYDLYMLLLLFIIPIVVMVTTYVIICLKVWEFTGMRTDMRHGRVITPVTKERVHSSIGGVESSLLGTSYNVGARNAARAERKKDTAEDNKMTKQLIVMLVTVVVLFAVCWGPILINNVLVSFSHVDRLNYDHLKPMRTAFNLLSYVNSCINPIVYAFMSKNFRQSFKFAICACLRGKAFVRAYRFSMSIGSTRTSNVSNGAHRPGSLANREKSSSSANDNTQTHIAADDEIVELRALTHTPHPAV